MKYIISPVKKSNRASPGAGNVIDDLVANAFLTTRICDSGCSAVPLCGSLPFPVGR